MPHYYRNKLLKNYKSISKVANQQPQALASEGPYTKLAAVAQALMLILVGFGYWYTVLPVYQKSLLDEDIAKKTIELNKTTGELASLKSVVDSKELELKNLQSSIGLLREQTLRAQTDASKARIASTKALQESALAKGDATAKYANLRRQSLSLFWGELLAVCVGASVSTEIKLVECVDTIAAKSGSFSQLNEDDRRTVIHAIRLSIQSSKESWNAVSAEHTAQQKILKERYDRLVTEYAEVKKNDDKIAPIEIQAKLDRIGKNYEWEKKLSDARFDLIKHDITLSQSRGAVLKKILAIAV
jgi:hypothetical protein